MSRARCSSPRWPSSTAFAAAGRSPRGCFASAEVALARELQARLHAAVAGLGRDEQHLVALRYGAGMSFEEVANSLGIASGAARVRMHRVIEQLRRRYPDDA